LRLLRTLQPQLLKWLRDLGGHCETIVSAAGEWWGEVSGKGRQVMEAVGALQRYRNTPSSPLFAALAGGGGGGGGGQGSSSSAFTSTSRPHVLIQDLVTANKGMSGLTFPSQS
jgi:hypothetical protein